MQIHDVLLPANIPRLDWVLGRGRGNMAPTITLKESKRGPQTFSVNLAILLPDARTCRQCPNSSLDESVGSPKTFSKSLKLEVL